MKYIVVKLVFPILISINRAILCVFINWTFFRVCISARVSESLALRREDNEKKKRPKEFVGRIVNAWRIESSPGLGEMSSAFRLSPLLSSLSHRLRLFFSRYCHFYLRHAMSDAYKLISQLRLSGVSAEERDAECFI